MDLHPCSMTFSFLVYQRLLCSHSLILLKVFSDILIRSRIVHLFLFCTLVPFVVHVYMSPFCHVSCLSVEVLRCLNLSSILRTPVRDSLL